MSQRARHLPTEDELLLLRAACLPGSDALAAWSTWQARNDLQTSDKTAFDLLPAVYRNLTALGSEPDAVMRGIYRRSWVQNQKLFQSAADVLRLFDEHRIPTLLLKGGALATTYYPDSGTRPMYDVDVLVPTDRAEAAYELLRSRGWQPLVTPGGPMAHVVQVVRSSDLEGPDGSKLDLHWHALVDDYDTAADADFWDAAVDLTFNRVPAKSLCPSDLLLHVLLHGARYMPTRSVLWVMDAYRVIAGSEVLDWERLTRQARERGLVLPVRTGLEYVRDELGADVPAETIRVLRREPVGLLDRLEFRADSAGDSFPAMATRDLLGHVRRTRGKSLSQRVESFGWYLQASWGVPSAGLLPLLVARRLYDRLRRAVASRRDAGA